MEAQNLDYKTYVQQQNWPIVQYWSEKYNCKTLGCHCLANDKVCFYWVM